MFYAVCPKVEYNGFEGRENSYSLGVFSSMKWGIDWVLICICRGVLTSAENTEIKLPWLALMSSRQRFTSLNLMKRPLIYTVKVHIALASGWRNKPGWSEQPFSFQGVSKGMLSRNSLNTKKKKKKKTTKNATIQRGKK